MDTTERTLQYYNQNAVSFVADTAEVSFAELQDAFLTYIKPGGKILDFGCGSGRDSRYFIDHGFQVVFVDGSEKMCELASAYMGQPVICTTFQRYLPTEMFDGIWACASLLHLEFREIESVMKKLTAALITGGCFYVSFKYGEFSGERNGRFFTDMQESTLKALVSGIPNLELQLQFNTQDVRPNRKDGRWLNAFLIKQ